MASAVEPEVSMSATLASAAESEASMLASLINETSVERLDLSCWVSSREAESSSEGAALRRRLREFLATATGDPRRVVLESLLEPYVAAGSKSGTQPRRSLGAAAIVQHCAQALQRSVRCWQARLDAARDVRWPIDDDHRECPSRCAQVFVKAIALCAGGRRRLGEQQARRQRNVRSSAADSLGR